MATAVNQQLTGEVCPAHFILAWEKKLCVQEHYRNQTSITAFSLHAPTFDGGSHCDLRITAGWQWKCSWWNEVDCDYINYGCCRTRQWLLNCYKKRH